MLARQQTTHRRGTILLSPSWQRLVPWNRRWPQPSTPPLHNLCIVRPPLWRQRIQNASVNQLPSTLSQNGRWSFVSIQNYNLKSFMEGELPEYKINAATSKLSRSGSSVGTAIGYGLDGPGIESRWVARFSAPVQTGPGAHPASFTMGTGSFPGVKSGRGVTLTPHPLIVPWSRKNRAIPLLPLWACTQH